MPQLVRRAGRSSTSIMCVASGRPAPRMASVGELVREDADDVRLDRGDRRSTPLITNAPSDGIDGVSSMQVGAEVREDLRVEAR